MEGSAFEKGRDSNKRKLEDACNQLVWLKFFQTTEKIREALKEHLSKEKFKTLEDYTNLSKEEIEECIPGMTDKYNSFIEEISDYENITIDRALEIEKEIFSIIRSKN